jgi:phosphoribosyl-ATP pyrophosphohydrolase / phosphoribosyl-AMP cyclohydrolase / histidinol dehydrogenase
LDRRSCFDDGYGIEKLSRTIAARQKEAPEGSYTRRLFSDSGLLAAKLREEADELALASGPAEASFKAADVIYFALVKALCEGARLADIEQELELRSFKVQRRPGNAKPGYDSAEGGPAWTGIH